MQLVSILFGIAVLAGAVWLVTRSADDLRAAVAGLGLEPVIVAGVLGLFWTIPICQVWFSLLRGLSVAAPWFEAAPVFFVSQLGKYVPGSVWPVVAQMEFGRRWNTPRRTMLTANILMLAVLAATGLITGAALLPWSTDGGLGRYWWTLLFLPPLLLALHPRTIPAVLDWLFRLLGREPLNVRPSGRSMLAATIWSFAVWLVMGLQLLTLVRALGMADIAATPAAVGGMGLAWAAGLIFIPAPAGAGVRDAVIVAIFAPHIGTAPALAVALASRVLLLLADVVLALAGAAAFPRRRRPTRS